VTAGRGLHQYAGLHSPGASRRLAAGLPPRCSARRARSICSSWHVGRISHRLSRRPELPSRLGDRAGR
jgi:hypothetical protein